MSTDGQRSRSLRIDAKVTREAGGSAGGGAAAGKGTTWPGEEKGDPVEKENDDSRVGSGGSSVVCVSPSLISTLLPWLTTAPSKGLDRRLGAKGHNAPRRRGVATAPSSPPPTHENENNKAIRQFHFTRAMVALRDGGELWGPLQATGPSIDDVLNARKARAERQIAYVARAERQIAGLASVGVVGLRRPISPPQPISPPRPTRMANSSSTSILPFVHLDADGAGSLLPVQQMEAESSADTRRTMPRMATMGDALSSQLAGARDPSIREERTGYLGASLTRPFGHLSRPEHAAYHVAAQKRQQKQQMEEERRMRLLLTTPGKRRQKTSYTAARLHSSYTAARRLQSSPPRRPSFTEQPRRPATADPACGALAAEPPDMPLDRWQQTLTPWSAPSIPNARLAAGPAQRLSRRAQAGSEAQLFRNLDLDTPGSLARTAAYYGSQAAAYRPSYDYGPRHAFAGRDLVDHLDPSRRPVSS